MEYLNQIKIRLTVIDETRSEDRHFSKRKHPKRSDAGPFATATRTLGSTSEEGERIDGTF